MSHRAILKLVFDLTRRGICLDMEESAGNPSGFRVFMENVHSQENLPAAKQARALLSFPAVMHSRRAFLSAFLTAAALLAGPCLLAGDAEEIQPPFNLRWGEPAVGLEEALLGTSARIVERSKAGGGREIWKVEGLPGIAVQRVNFHLRESRLTEVEIQYWKEDWSPATYEDFMQSVRRRLDEKYGPGKATARQQESERGIMKTLVGYRWESAGSAVELYYFAAADPKNVFRSISLHYKSAPPNPAPAGRADPAPGRAADELTLPSR